MTTSATNAFEDAEIAREELRSMAAVIMYSASGIDLDAASSGTPEAISACRVADALISLGYSRQSPASTTAADLPVIHDQLRYVLEEVDGHFSREKEFEAYWDKLLCEVDPYRVAAPEGDGGNE